MSSPVKAKDAVLTNCAAFGDDARNMSCDMAVDGKAAERVRVKTDGEKPIQAYGDSLYCDEARKKNALYDKFCGTDGTQRVSLKFGDKDALDKRWNVQRALFEEGLSALGSARANMDDYHFELLRDNVSKCASCTGGDMLVVRKPDGTKVVSLNERGDMYIGNDGNEKYVRPTALQLEVLNMIKADIIARAKLYD